LRDFFIRLLREPLVHFLVIGAAVFVVYELMDQQDPDEQRRVITITAGDIDWLTSSWEKRWNRPPTAEEREGLIKQYLREMILYREAIAMGLDRDDTVIRRRMAQKLEFLTQDLASPESPTEGALRDYFQTHAEKYQSPDLITLTHIFFNPDKRGDRTLEDAKIIKETLEAQKQVPEDVRSYGDPFMLQSYYPERSQIELSKLFGSGFARPVFELAPEVWHGPVLSGYGVHLVYVHEIQKASPPKFAEVKEQLQKDWQYDKRQKLNDQFIASLMARYDITIEDGPAGKKINLTREATR
jgi:hypothetical protein